MELEMRRYWDDEGDHNIIELLIPLWAHIMLLPFILGMIFVIDDNMVYTTHMSACQQHYYEYNEQKSCSWLKIVENFYEILYFRLYFLLPVFEVLENYLLHRSALKAY